MDRIPQNPVALTSWLFRVVLVFMILSHNATAGGWPQGKGNGFFKLGLQFMQAERVHNDEGQIVPIPTLTDMTFAAYGEYGITEGLTMIAMIPFYKHLSIEAGTNTTTGKVIPIAQSTFGIADIEVGARYGLWRGERAALSVAVMLGLPTGEERHAYDLLTGDGEFNQYFSLQAGYSFFPTAAYVSTEIGINNRTNGYSDEWRFGFETGYALSQKFTIIGRVFGVRSLRNGEKKILPNAASLYSNNTSYIAYGPMVLFYTSEHFGLTATVVSVTSAKNIFDASLFSAGIFMRLLQAPISQ